MQNRNNLIYEPKAEIEKAFKSHPFKFVVDKNGDQQSNSDKIRILNDLLAEKGKSLLRKKDSEANNWILERRMTLNSMVDEVYKIEAVSNALKTFLVLDKNNKEKQKFILRPTPVSQPIREKGDEAVIEKKYIDSRREILVGLKKKISDSLSRFDQKKQKSKRFLSKLEEEKIEFDYETNLNILKLDYKPQNIIINNKIILFFSAPMNFPDATYYRSLITVDTKPKDEIEYDLSKLKKKMDDLFEKNLNITLAYKKDKQKKSLITFQLRKVKKKFKEMEFKLLNIQLFNYLLQILQFGKALPSDFPHTKSYLEIDCGNNFTLELIYKDKEREGKEVNSDFVLYILLLWAVYESPIKQVKSNLADSYGFLGIYVRIKKKLNKLKSTIPGFFYTEEINPSKLEVYFEVKQCFDAHRKAFLGYSKQSSFMIFKRYGPQMKRKIFLIRGNKLYLVNNTLGFTNEVSIETFIKEDLKEYFYFNARNST